MTREQRKREIHDLAEKIFIALINNSSRYNYISQLLEAGEITQEEATQKNISKAYKLATAFIDEKAKYI